MQAAATPLRAAGRQASATRTARGRDCQRDLGQAGPSIPPGLRFVEIAGDSMEPMLYRGDFVLAARVERWAGEGYYLVGGPIGGEALYQCSASGTRAAPTILMHSRNTHYSDWHMSRAAFELAVTGKAVMTCNVKDRDLINQHRECFSA